MRAVVVATLLLASYQTSLADDPPPYRLVDLTDEYTRFYDRTTSMTTQERVVALKAELGDTFPGFYDDGRFSGMITAETYDAWIAESFEEFPALRETYERTAAAFADMLAPAHASFVEAFPELAPVGDIYLVHSVGEMDGGTRMIGDRIVLVFGADRMAQHPLADWTPFFHHEFFHVYHQQFFQGCPQVWCFLWVEGMATYASAMLNPDATDAELLLTRPEPIPEAVDTNLAEAVCATAARLDSRESADYGALFSTGRLNERLPPRFGYYVGKLVVREATREAPLQDLAKLSEAQARPVMEQALAQLATCGEGGA